MFTNHNVRGQVETGLLLLLVSIWRQGGTISSCSESFSPNVDRMPSQIIFSQCGLASPVFVCPQVECLPKYCAKTCKDQQGFTHQVQEYFEYWALIVHKMSSVRVLNRRATGGSWTATSASASTGARWLARGRSATRRAGTRTGTPTKSGTGSYLDRTV